LAKKLFSVWLESNVEISMGIIKIKKKYFPHMRNLYLSGLYGFSDNITYECCSVRKVSLKIKKMLVKADSFRN